MADAVAWDAAKYEEVASVQQAWGRQLIDSRTWRGDEVVLDAGCGTGQLAEQILKRVPRGRVVCVDMDASMVQQASERLRPQGARAQVFQKDLLRLDGVDPVDVIFSNAVLHWIPDHDKAFEVFLKHLKPGGELVLQCGGEGNLAHVRGLASEVMHVPAFEKFFGAWTPPWRYEDDTSTEERLFIAGFVHPKVDLTPAPTKFADRSSFEKFLRAVVLLPYLRRIPTPKEQDAFVAEFIRRCEASGWGHNLDYVRLNVRAQRSPHH